MTNKIESPKNQYALVVRLLIDYYQTGVTMADASKHYFHKFGNRLKDVERSRMDKLKIRRLPMTKKNRFGHTCTFLNYKSLAPKAYLINLLAKLNREGIKKSA